MTKPTASEWQTVLDDLPKKKTKRARAGVADTTALPASAKLEKHLQKDIMNAIRAHGLWVVKVEVQGSIQRTGAGTAVLRPSQLAGFPDLLVIGPEGTTAWLEVKTPKGRTSALQDGRLARLSQLGHVAAVVRSVDQALAVLKTNQFIFSHMNEREFRAAAGEQ